MSVKTFPDQREVCENNAAGKREYEQRKMEMWSRQLEMCAICGRWIPSNLAFFDHQDGRGHGGGHRDDRIMRGSSWFNAALCYGCNGQKGSKRYEWVDGVYQPVPPKEPA